MTSTEFETTFLGATVVSTEGDWFRYSFPGGTHRALFDTVTGEHISVRVDASAHFDWLRSYKAGIRRDS